MRPLVGCSVGCAEDKRKCGSFSPPVDSLFGWGLGVGERCGGARGVAASAHRSLLVTAFRWVLAGFTVVV